jgi:hypothetical protein
MYYRASITINPKMIFGRKRCPVCGKKMKIYINKVPFDNIEKKLIGDQPSYYGGILPGTILNGELQGYKGTQFLKCKNCKLILDDLRYKIVRKKQKELNRFVLTKEELEELFQVFSLDESKFKK